jgi:hypothetical protein
MVPTAVGMRKGLTSVVLFYQGSLLLKNVYWMI